MENYKNALKYAQLILRVRDGLIDGSIGQEQRVTCKNEVDHTNFDMIVGKRFYTQFGQRPYNIGSVIKESNPHTFSIINSKVMIFDQRSETCFLTMSGDYSFVITPNYDEGLYFQDSLLYSDAQMFYIVVANYLAANPMKDYDKFTIYFKGVGKISKLLDRKNHI